MLPIVILKSGKDIPVRAGHPWIFSHALECDTVTEPGELVEVRTHDGQSLGLGTRNGGCSIRIRLLTRDASETIDTKFFAQRFTHLDNWKRSHLPADTDGYRLVHAEADGLPGLIVDRYADTFVFQIHTAGMERLREAIVEALRKTFKPSYIVERSDVAARRLEGLTDQPTGVRFPSAIETVSPITFHEAGLTFLVDVLHGQKTGFFLDQRNARLAVGRLARGRRVLNLFGYTGAFSLHAACGGAAFVNTVDVSRAALEGAQENFKLNQLDPEDEKRFAFLEAEVLDLLAADELPDGPYDLIVCDPPAFAKSEAQIPQAIKAYTDLNAACLRHLTVGGILVTSSCSGRLEGEAFRDLLRHAAGRARRDVRLLDWLTQPFDHAERLAFPEGRYLKTAVLEVTNRLS